MRSIAAASLLVALLLPAVADAGQVYGTIVMGGQGVKDAMLDKLLVSIKPDELAKAEERARFWPDDVPTQVAENARPVAPGKPAGQ